MKIPARTAVSAFVASAVPALPFLAIALLVKADLPALQFAGMIGLIAAAHVLLLGLPAFFLLWRMGSANAWTLLAVGFVLGFVPAAIYSWPGPPVAGQLLHWLSRFGGPGFFGILGAFSARAFWAAWCGWALTVHSSRSRFAARLNSGVRCHMRLLASSLFFLLALAGCKIEFNTGGAQSTGVPGTPEQQKQVRAAAERIVNQIDAQQWDSLWESTSPSLKKTTSELVWTGMLKTSRGTFGPAKARKIAGYSFTDKLDGAPPGNYGIVFYTTDFSSLTGVEEQVVLIDNSGQWQLAGYWVIKKAKL